MDDNAALPNRVIVKVDATGNLSCTPAILSVSTPNVDLLFIVQTTGWAFPASNAVVVADPGTQFPNGSQTVPPANTRATLYDANTLPGDFAYTVTVQHVTSGQVLRLDPTIRNEA